MKKIIAVNREVGGAVTEEGEDSLAIKCLSAERDYLSLSRVFHNQSIRA